MGQGLRAALAGDAPDFAVAALEEVVEAQRAVLGEMGARHVLVEAVGRRVQQGLSVRQRGSLSNGGRRHGSL